ncbi:MAG: HIG1 domain-containing protein [Rickettsiales bacterium]|nr:HIG1 domain-containing protein [Rickettsiales bacterium]
MLSIITFIFIIFTFAIVAVGSIAMIKGGEFNKKYSNILMRMRVTSQAISLFLLFCLYMSN